MPIPLIAGAVWELAKIAGPSIVRAVSGDKAGDVADELVEAAKFATGEQDADRALTALKADPSMMVAYKSRILENLEKIQALANEDRADARSRDVELRKISGHNWRADILAVGLMVAVGFLLHHAVTAQIPEANTRLVDMLIGALLMRMADVFHFEFGSSAGSKDKDAALSRISK